MKNEPPKSATAIFEASGEKQRPQFVIENNDFVVVLAVR